MVETKYWGEYGPYRVDENGLPYFSDVVRDFIERSGISVEQFGQIYGTVARAQGPYTKSRIYQMIRNNSFPTDRGRRWLLAKLLHIPPVLLGIASLDELLLLEEREEKVAIAKARTLPDREKGINLEEYRQALLRYWRSHRTDTSFTVQDDIKIRIARLEREALYGERLARDKVQIGTLLCGYHMMMANIATDQEWYDRAVMHLNRAYSLAKEHQLYKLQVAILCRRGWALKERGEAAARIHNFDTANQDLTFATRDFELALSLVNEKHLYPALNGSILLSLGKLHADVAQTPGALHQAIKEIDKAEAFINKGSGEYDIHFIKLDEERYHMDRAAAYLAAPVRIAQYPRDARRELRNAAVQSKPDARRRQAYATILAAKSYFIEAEYAEAARKAREALVVVREIHSTINIARIATLCDGLKASDYGKGSIEVAALEIEVMKAKLPAISG